MEEQYSPSKRFIGVFFDLDNDTWVAEIETPDGIVELGQFLDELAAARAYDAAASELLDNPELNFTEE